MKRSLTESSSDTIIRELHRIREEIVDSFDGDLQKLTEDAQRRQEASGKRIWRRGELSTKVMHPSDGSGGLPAETPLPPSDPG